MKTINQIFYYISFARNCQQICKRFLQMLDNYFLIIKITYLKMDSATQIGCLELRLIRSSSPIKENLFLQNASLLSKNASFDQRKNDRQSLPARPRFGSNSMTIKTSRLEQFKQIAQQYFNLLKESAINAIAQKQDDIDKIKSEQEKAQKLQRDLLESHQRLKNLQTCIKAFELELEDERELYKRQLETKDLLIDAQIDKIEDLTNENNQLHLIIKQKEETIMDILGATGKIAHELGHGLDTQVKEESSKPFKKIQYTAEDYRFLVNAEVLTQENKNYKQLQPKYHLQAYEQKVKNISNSNENKESKTQVHQFHQFHAQVNGVRIDSNSIFKSQGTQLSSSNSISLGQAYESGSKVISKEDSSEQSSQNMGEEKTGLSYHLQKDQ